VRDLAGLKLDPFSETCTLSPDPSVNYLMHLEREASQS
jgi:2-polyprenyl-3-methyl-5-hydroxy-6-metoxy-1,4-benzoquinol methylase